MIVDVFEIIMLICFGLSWPVNAVRAWKAGTARSTSAFFLIIVMVGYAAGIVAKLLSPSYRWYVLAAYIINLVDVGINFGIYLRNVRRDRLAGC